MRYVLSAGYSSVELHELEVYEMPGTHAELVCYGNGRYSGPDKWFHDLVTKYAVDATYVDAEGGNDFFFKKEWKEGVVVSIEEANYVSKESIAYAGADNIAAEFSWILDEEDWESEYDYILEAFSDAGYSPEQFKKLAEES
jgi:hypothetical protein